MTTTIALARIRMLLLLRNKTQFLNVLPGKSFWIQVITSGALAATGDIICQKYVEKREKLNIKRTSIFAVTSMLLIAPVQFNWFRFLERRFPVKNTEGPVGRIKTTVKRVALDQSCMAPILTACFLFSVNFLDSKSHTKAWQRLKSIYPEVITNNYKFWPFVQLVNMTVVPLQFRVIFLQFFAIFWNIYVSNRANN